MANVRRSMLHSAAVSAAKIQGTTSGQVLIGQGATSAPAWKALSGDATISAAGVVTVSGATLGNVTIVDGDHVAWGTPGTDVVITADGTDAVLTGTGGLVRVDSFVDYWGTGKDIGMAWDGARLVVSQAAPDSAIRWGANGAGIDQVFFLDTTGSNITIDQSDDAMLLVGVAKLKYAAIADPGTGVAIPVTASGTVAITTAAAETNTLADPTYAGQFLSLFVDTYAVGNRVVTAASRINQAANTIMTFGSVGDFIKLEAITIAGALKWQVVSNDGVALS